MFANDFPPGTTFWEVNDSRCKSRAVAALPDDSFVDAVTGQPISDMVFGEYVERLWSPEGLDEFIRSLESSDDAQMDALLKKLRAERKSRSDDGDFVFARRGPSGGPDPDAD